MKRWGQITAATAVLAASGCGGEQGKLEIRAGPTPIASTVKAVPIRVAEGRGQLALGNVALALESFRKAARDDPQSVDAYAGMAQCYDRMGRHDLSRRNYEAALALAPADTELLGAFSATLERQGLTSEALAVREEIAERHAAATPKQIVEVARIDAPTAPVASMVPAVAPAAPAATSAVVEAPAKPAGVPQAPKAPAIAVAAVAPVVPAPAAPVLKPLPKPVVGTSVTVALPPARPARPAIAPKAPPPTVAATATPAHSTVAAVQKPDGPRLERLSLGEVALVTKAAPQWRPKAMAQRTLTTTVRFVPLRKASVAVHPVRLLNAARVHRLAARHRAYLLARGWRGLAIGDAPTVRMHSVVLYPAGKQAAAQRLASQFGFPTRRHAGSYITVLLGRDSVRRSRAG